MRSLMSLILGLLALSTGAHAQNFSDPMTLAGRRTHVAGVFSASEIDYEAHGTEDTIKRKILGAEAATGVGNDFDVFGQFGIIMDSEVDNVDDDGSGYTFGFGAKALAHKASNFRVVGYGVYTYQKDNFDETLSKIEISTYDLHVGGVIGVPASPTLLPYGGLDVVLINDGDAKVKVKGGGSSTNDFERDDVLNLKMGVLFNLSAAVLRAEATLLGESTLTFAVGTYF